MKVLIVGGHAVEGFTTHILEGLAELGHDARIYDYFLVSGSRLPALGRSAVERFVSTVRRGDGPLARSLTRRLRRTLAEEGPFDLVLSVHDFLLPREVELLKDTGAKVAVWFPDPVGSLGREYFVAAPYDAVFLKEPFLVAKLRAGAGVPAFYLPECFSPRRHGPVPLTAADRARYGCDVTTAGSLYSYRAALLAGLDGLDVKIWGGDVPFWLDAWPHRNWVQGHFVAYQEKAKAFLAAKIVVNTLRPSEIWGTNVRTFEIPGSGAFCLCEWTAGLSQLFEPGREIETFRSRDELAEKARRHLADDVGRERIAAAGHRRALADHTYANRLTLLIATLRGEAAGYPLPDVTLVPHESGAGGAR